MTKIAIVGGGMLGGTLLGGLFRSGVLHTNVAVVEKSPERAEHLRNTFGVSVEPVGQAVGAADVVFLIVKPQDMEATVSEVAPSLRPEALVVSLAAGITTAFLESRLPSGTPVVRVMPNTPAQVGMGMAAVSPGTSVDSAHLDLVEGLLAPLGLVVRVPEDMQDAVTAVSGSGPAYVFYVIEAMVDAGVRLGLPADVAKQLTVQTVLGAATMVRDTGTDPATLREQVTSPNGTTAAALATLGDRGVHDAFVAAIEAASDRSRELAAGG